MSIRKSWLVALPAALMLGGCGLPPAVVVASYALDGFSFMVSGKSVSDHAISRAMNKDCSMIRVIAGRQVCEELNDGTSPATEVAAAAQNDNWNSDAALAAAAGHKLELAVSTPRLGTQGAARAPSIAGLLPWEFRPQPVPRYALLTLDGPAASPLADFIGLEQFFAGQGQSGAMIGGNADSLARAGNPPLWSPAAWEFVIPPAPMGAAKVPLMGKSLAPAGLEYPAARLATLAGAGSKSLSPEDASMRPAADDLDRLPLSGDIRLSAEPERVAPMDLAVTVPKLALRRGPAGARPVIARLPLGE